MKEKISIIEALYFLDALGVEKVSVKHLITTFQSKPEEQPPQAPAEQPPATPQQLPPELPEPPTPPTERVYPGYTEATKDAKKGEETVFDKNKGGFINTKK